MWEAVWLPLGITAALQIIKFLTSWESKSEVTTEFSLRVPARQVPTS